MIEEFLPSSCTSVSRFFVATKGRKDTNFYTITELMGKRFESLEKYEEGAIVCKGAMGYFAVATWSGYDVKSDAAVDLKLRGLFPDIKDARLFAKILDGTDSLKCARI